MNFAFQAVFFLLLLIPGFVFRSNYNGRILKDQLQNFTPYSNEAIYVITTSALLNSIWVSFSNCIGALDVIALQVNLQTVMFLLIGNYSDASLLQKAINSVINHPTPILLYFITLYIFSSLLGYLAHTTVRKYNLDKKYTFFRFRNSWHYLLTGEITAINNSSYINDVDLVVVSAIVDEYLYIGTVADYELDEHGNLCRLTLEETYRRKLDDDAADENANDITLNDDSRYYKIKGEYFILDCDKTRNLNIDYWYLSEEND